MAATLTAPDLYSDIDNLESRVNALEIIVGYIAPGSIGGDEIAPGSINSTHIAFNSITTDHLVAGSVTAVKIAAGTITAGNIMAGTITANEIAANTITANQIAASTITGDRIVADTITGREIFGTTLSGIFSDMGNITAGTITGGIIQTSSGNPKVIMDSSGIRGIASNGSTLVNIDAATGKITATGIIIAEAGSAIPSGSLTGQLTAAQIASVNAAVIVGQITAAQFSGTFGGSNLLTNSGFDDTVTPLNHWSVVAGTGASVTSPVRDGAQALRITADASAIPYVHRSTTADKATITAGLPYAASAYVRSSSTTRPMRISIRWSDSSDTFLSETLGAYVTSSTNQWNRVTVSGTAPASAAKANIRVYVSDVTPANGEIHYVDSTQLENGDVITSYAPPVDEILPGTVGTTELAANAVTASKIAANTITAAQIAANTITSTQILAHTITSGEIAAGTITANELAANSVTSNKILAGSIDTTKLTIVPGNTINLIPISTFEYDTGMWTSSGATFTRSSAQAFHGSYSVALTCTSAGPVSFDNNAARIPVSVGNQYTASAYIRANTVARSCALNIAWFDNTGTQIGSTVVGSAANDSTSAWTRFTVTGTAPTNAVSCRVFVLIGAVAVGEIHYIDAIQLEAGSSATAYIPNGTEFLAPTLLPTLLTAEGITTDKIKSRTILADRIAAGVITATEIAATSITGDRLVAGTITATQIAAGTIDASRITVAVGGGNMMPNPSFEPDYPGGSQFSNIFWTVVSGSWTTLGFPAGNAPVHGANAYRIGSSASANTIVVASAADGTALVNKVSVRAAIKYTLSAYVWHDSATAKTFRLGASFYDSGNAAIGSITYGTAVVVQPNTNTRLTYSVTAPTAAKGGRMVVEAQSMGNLENFEVDAVQWEEGDFATQFNPLSIRGITSTEILPGSITTQNLVATAIDTMTVTLGGGGKVQTNAGTLGSAVAKVQFDGTGIWAQDSLGVLMFQLNAGSGTGLLRGKLISHGGVEFPVVRGTDTKITWTDGTNTNCQIDGFYGNDFTGTQRNAVYLQAFTGGSPSGGHAAISVNHTGASDTGQISVFGGLNHTYTARCQLDGVTRWVVNQFSSGSSTDGFFEYGGYLSSGKWQHAVDSTPSGSGSNLETHAMRLMKGSVQVAWWHTTGDYHVGTGNVYVHGRSNFATVYYGDADAGFDGPWAQQWDVSTGRFDLWQLRGGAWVIATYFAYNAGTAKYDQWLSGVITQNSDISLKTDIQDLKFTDSFSVIKGLRPRKFKWKGGNPNYEDHGFIAQEVEAVYPKAVAASSDTDLKSLDYSKLTTALVVTMQEAVKRIETLEAELSTLKGKLKT